MNASAAPANEGDGWQARLSLGIAHDGRQSRLRERVHEGPLYVQRPFYPEGDLCHVYILHPPGGMVGGDVIQIDISVAEEASALITTPASAKVYKSAGHTSKIHQSLIVEAGAVSSGCLRTLSCLEAAAWPWKPMSAFNQPPNSSAGR